MYKSKEARAVTAFILSLRGRRYKPFTKEEFRDLSCFRESYRKRLNSFVRNVSIDERHFVAFGIRLILCVHAVRLDRRKRVATLTPSVRTRIRELIGFWNSNHLAREDLGLRSRINELLRELETRYDEDRAKLAKAS